MTSPATVVPLLVFEAADCLMAIPASEVGHLKKSGREGFSQNSGENSSRPLFDSDSAFDLGEYFGGCQSHGPWLQWMRGPQNASLRVQRVVDVLSIDVSSLTAMPVLLRGERRTRAFLAAGVSGQEVFLLLDPARLGNLASEGDSVGTSSVGRDCSRAARE